MNNNHLRTHPTRETASTGWTSHVDVLNSVIDPIDVLSEAELQNELALYANAQFTFDTMPGVAVEDKPHSGSSFGIYRQPSSHSDTHQHQQKNQQQQQQHQLGLDISMATDGTMFNDAATSTVSSPYEQRQHYFSPLSSLPTSPTKLHKNDERQLDPLLSFMILSTDQQRNQPSLHQDSLHHSSMSQSTSTNESILKTDRDDIVMPKKKSTPRRRAQSTPGRQCQKDENETTGATARQNKEKHGSSGDNQDADYYLDEDDGGGDGATDDDLIKLDKRRRNTAASARFRIKKKMREQSLQRTACEMTEKAKVLENRVHELEREVKWLKDLIVAKNRS